MRVNCELLQLMGHVFVIYPIWIIEGRGYAIPGDHSTLVEPSRIINIYIYIYVCVCIYKLITSHICIKLYHRTVHFSRRYYLFRGAFFTIAII